MIYNPFEKIKELERQVKTKQGNINWLNTQIEHLSYVNKDSKVLIEHWRGVAKFTFLALAIETLFLIYLLGTV